MNYNLLLFLLIISIQISYGSTYDEQISYESTFDEQVQILQKLKELFITDFNSFLDYAIDTVNLDYLEMEIPIHFLKYFRLDTPSNFNGDAPHISIERFYNVRRGQNKYSLFTTKGKLTKDSYKYKVDDAPNLTKIFNENGTLEFFSQKQINFSQWEPIKFKMFFQKNSSHQISIFDKVYPFSCFNMLFRDIPGTLSAEGHYFQNQKFVYPRSIFSLDDATYFLDVWENNGVFFNFQSEKTLFLFSQFAEEQTPYYLNNYFSEEDPNAYLYLNYWQNINYFNFPSDDFEDFPIFEENIFKNEEENSSVDEETFSDTLKHINSLKISNSTPKNWLHFLLTKSPLFTFENEAVDISNNPYLKNSSTEATDQNSFFEENSFDIN